MIDLASGIVTKSALFQTMRQKMCVSSPAEKGRNLVFIVIHCHSYPKPLTLNKRGCVFLGGGGFSLEINQIAVSIKVGRLIEVVNSMQSMQ